MHDWQVFLANSDDLTRIAEISSEARSKSFSLAMNRAGSFGFTLPLSTAYFDYLNPSEHCVIVQKNKVVVWSGPIWTKEEDFESGKINIGAVGWFQMLHKRYVVDADHNYITTGDGAIAFDLLAYANAQNVGGVRPTWITAGSNGSATSRTMTISQFQNIGQEIENLTDVESGFDFTIDPVTREMDIHAWNSFPDNGLIFGVEWGPNNARGFTRSTNSDDQGNQYYVVGQTLTAEANDPTSIGTYNLHQQVINLNEADNSGLLGAIANAEVAVNKDPRVTITFLPKPPSANNDFPSVFEDFDLRHKVYLTAERDNVRIENLAVRVFGFGLDIDENGNEKVSSLQTTYQSGG